jgi:hypothetical protein
MGNQGQGPFDTGAPSQIGESEQRNDSQQCDPGPQVRAGCSRLAAHRSVAASIAVSTLRWVVPSPDKGWATSIERLEQADAVADFRALSYRNDFILWLA